MRCPSCAHNNRAERRFCAECGAVLGLVCAACGAANQPGEKFCGGCGERLPTVAPAPATPTATPETEIALPAGERRQLTVLFCDLVGSTPLSQQLDPEDLRTVVRAYQEAAAGAIQRHSGHIAQYLGDGLLVYFGYPQAHEDDADRAVRAGLEILTALGELNATLAVPQGIRLAARVGIHTGAVVIDEMGGGAKSEILAVGDTTNVAARVQAAAEPDTVVISGATQRLVVGMFVVEDRGPQTLKGVREPVSLYRVVQPSGVRSRLALAGASGLTPLVGREREVALLLNGWEEAKAGHGQVILLSAEPGIGKSRLIEVLRERVADEPHTWHEYRGSAYHQSSAFHPVIEMVERALAFTESDGPEERLAKLTRGLGYSGFPMDEILPLIADFLSLPAPENVPPLALGPEDQRKRTMETLCLWPLSLAQRQPMIMIAEDLHWMDPSTLELAGMTIAQIPAASILLVATFRPEFEPPWPGSSRLMHLPLQPLNSKQIEEMSFRITDGKRLPRKVREQIVARTDGVPLFVEELVKSVLESGLVIESEGVYERTDPLPDLAIPTTLRDSLTARLDRLGPGKRVAQLAAVVGREFPYDLLQAVSPLEPAALEQGLEELVAAGLLYQRGIPPRATYSFKHVLIRDAAHESLLKKTRREYHLLVAKALERHFEDRARAEPELLAQHYDGAGFGEQAAALYGRAGMSAAGRSANQEAIRHLKRGLELLDTLPEGRKRSQWELEMELALGACVAAVKGYSHDDVASTFGRARELCRHQGETSLLARALVGLFYFHFTRTNFEATIELAREIVELGQRAGESSIEMVGHVIFAFPFFHQGRFRAALEHFDRAINLYDPSRARALAVTYGHDFGVLAQGYSALALWALGYPDQALERSRRSQEHARAGEHLHTVAWVLGATLLIRQMRREVDQVLEVAEDLVALADRHAFAWWRGTGKTLRGWAVAVSGHSDDGIEGYREGMQLCAATGAQFLITIALGMGAEAFTAAGQSKRAMRALDMGLGLAQNGEQFWVAELHRLKSELLLAMEGCGEQEAEQELQRALEIAREQEARSLELRAATSLARLWRDQGRPAEARALLAPLYDWFTEGFDTRDLRDANALLMSCDEDRRSGVT